MGLAEDAVRSALHKSFVRARNKMDSKDDHRHRLKPRPAFNIDLIRNLVMAMTPEMSKAFYTALLRRFGGAAKVNNLYALPEDERAARFNLVSLMVTVVFDPGMTYGELCQLPETQRIWDEYTGTPRGETEDWWRNLCGAARRCLESPAMASQPVLVLGEVQILLRQFAEIRHEMHSPYKGWWGVDDTQVYLDYLQGRPDLAILAPAAGTYLFTCLSPAFSDSATWRRGSSPRGTTSTRWTRAPPCSTRPLRRTISTWWYFFWPRARM